jgi:hypothetical protein
MSELRARRSIRRGRPATVLAEDKSQPIDQASAIPALLSAVKGAFTLAARR